MTILITGGAGFVGLAMVEELLTAGHNVITYAPEPVPKNIQDYFALLKGQLYCETGDICDIEGLNHVLRHHKIKKIVHAAAITAGLERERQNPQAVIQVNL